MKLCTREAPASCQVDADSMPMMKHLIKLRSQHKQARRQCSYIKNTHNVNLLCAYRVMLCFRKLEGIGIQSSCASCAAYSLQSFGLLCAFW